MSGSSPSDARPSRSRNISVVENVVAPLSASVPASVIRPPFSRIHRAAALANSPR